MQSEPMSASTSSGSKIVAGVRVSFGAHTQAEANERTHPHLINMVRS